VIQSFSDAIKLFVKEQFLPLKANKLIYFFSPIISLFVILIAWLRFPKEEIMIN
jgi:NADH:ubiquinone oxidoreductase subunit H